VLSLPSAPVFCNHFLDQLMLSNGRPPELDFMSQARRIVIFFILISDLLILVLNSCPFH
jgi:hypothetical protein